MAMGSRKDTEGANERRFWMEFIFGKRGERIVHTKNIVADIGRDCLLGD